MDLYIFNRELELTGVIDSFTSFTWTRKFYEPGTFSLTLKFTQKNFSLLQKENVIAFKGEDQAAYIDSIYLYLSSDGTENIKVDGKFVTNYLSRRINWGIFAVNDTYENIMRQLVDKNCINTTTERIIPNLALGSINNYTESANYNNSYDTLTDIFTSIAQNNNIGYKVVFDKVNRKLSFETYKGIDRSVNQSINARCVFSRDFENILEQSYYDTTSNLKNAALIAGAGEGTSRKKTSIGSSVGLDRNELFVDARDLSDTKYVDETEVTIPDADYTEMLVERGNEKLAERQSIMTFDSNINTNGNNKYKVDFDLGDIVTVIDKKWNVAIDTRITEIEEVYEENGMNINITFGNKVPTLIDKIKQQVVR